jgi:tRNA(Ile)-lysidine synthase
MGPHPAVAQARACVRQCLADLEPGDLVLAACSGGADSLALAAALAHEAPRLVLRGGGVTVDHGLQEGSAERAGQVTVTLARLGLDPVEQVSVAVPARPGHGGPEAAARTARYAALAEVAQRTGAAAVLLGHTRDDQAETVLLALARGSGARALGGMAARRGIFRRPLLGVGRGTLRDACHALQLEPWDDPHNQDPAYARVRVRRQALPALEAALGPGITEALARTAAQLSADCAALDTIAQAEEWRIYAPAPGGPGPGADAAQRAAVDLTGLAELAEAIRTRVLRSAALAAGCPGGSLSAGHIAALDALVTGWHGQRGADLPGAVRAERRYGRLLFSGGKPAGTGPPQRTEAEATGGRE